MKAFLIAITVILIVTTLWSQSIAGDWHGMLDVQGMKLRIVFHITETGDSLSGTFDSPDQGAFGLPAGSVEFADNILTLEATYPPLVYTGELHNGEIKGILKQAGMEFPLDLKQEELAKPVYTRPQEPKEPFPYKVEDVIFPNPEAGIKLAGTLTLPGKKGKHPAVVMITGSGPEDRNEEIFGHKPFWVIADHLTRHGIAVLRFDDRGYGASEGDFSVATTTDFASDVKSAVSYLKSRKEIGRIGLIGHSEGGIIAPLAAVDSKDVKFIVLLAGTGVRGDQLLLRQEELIWRLDEPDEDKIRKSLSINRNIFDLINKEYDTDSLTVRIRDFLQKSIADSLIDIPEGYSPEDVIGQYISQMTNPWMLYFLRHDPAPVLTQVTCPVLALNGSKDTQVEAKQNLPAIGAALEKGGNKNFKLMELDGLNHLFQECETGHPNEYAGIEQTIAPRVLETITAWIKQQTNLK